MNETDLIAAARCGDQTAFSDLYRQHIEYVRAIGRSILRKDDVDDMCQETFLLAFTRLDSFGGGSQFRSWITRIAINRCLVALRQARQVSNGELNLVRLDADAELDRYTLARIDMDLEAVPIRMDLDRLLDLLGPNRRRVLEMVYLEDMSELEIAEALGISLGAVKNRLHHAKRQMRSLGFRG
jgi:RNA polymerase sigma-70 factor, ECF subfamily